MTWFFCPNTIFGAPIGMQSPESRLYEGQKKSFDSKVSYKLLLGYAPGNEM